MNIKLKALTAWSILQYCGPRWVWFRLGYALRKHSGWLQRQTPVSSWASQPLARFLRARHLAAPAAYLAHRREHQPPFLFSSKQQGQFTSHLTAWDQDDCHPMVEADRLQKGDVKYFGHAWAHLGYPPQWHMNPYIGHRVAADQHWSRTQEFADGDIKIIREPSRFGFVYALVRSYWRTGNTSYAECFWQVVESWRLHNPPQQGPNWQCGQEISLRVMAWCFGLYGFWQSDATTATRVAALAQMIAVSGQRIEANLSYALSQANNHGVSEGVGLWTIGLLFPEFRDAARWRQCGRQALEATGRDLIYDDGAFSQHAVNYHRLMLHDYLWALRLGDIQGQSLSVDLKARVGRAGRLLYDLQDDDSGQLPRYGQNDGALILPLNNCDYADYRPVIQAVHYLMTSTRCYTPGRWDEDLLWLFGPSALSAPRSAPSRCDAQARDGGYYALRARTGFAFVRCGGFRHRPGQADIMHLDLWWRGYNMALDPGTYSYHAPLPWANPLAETAYHNTVTVDGREQMNRVSRFLWLPWLRGWVSHQQRSRGGNLAYWEGEHDGYCRLRPAVRYRRGIVRLGEAHWLVLDALHSTGEHRYRLHWLSPDFPYDWDDVTGHLTLQMSNSSYHIQVGHIQVGHMLAAASPNRSVASLVRADPHSPRGWQAPYYSAREPALSLALTTPGRSVLFWTLFGPDTCKVTVDDDNLRITADDWRARIHVATDHRASIVTSAWLDGLAQDQFHLTARDAATSW